MKHYAHPELTLLVVQSDDCLRTSVAFGDLGNDRENVIDGGILNL